MFYGSFGRHKIEYNCDSSHLKKIDDKYIIYKNIEIQIIEEVYTQIIFKSISFRGNANIREILYAKHKLYRENRKIN